MNKKHAGLQHLLDFTLIVALGLVILALVRVTQVGAPASTTTEATIPPREASQTPSVEALSVDMLPYPPPETPTDISSYPPPGTPSPIVTPLPTLTPSPTPTATPTPLVMPNGWYLYEDPDGEFSLTYPQDAWFHAYGGPLGSPKDIQIIFRNIQFKTPTSGGYQGMSIRLFPNPEHLSAEQIALKIYEYGGFRTAADDFLSHGEAIRIAGLPTLKIPIPSTNTELTLIVPNGDKYYTLSPVHDMLADNVDSATLELFYQVVETVVIN